MKKKWVMWALYAVVGYVVYKKFFDGKALATEIRPPPPPTPPMPYDTPPKPPDMRM